MATVTEEALADVERLHSEGISSGDLVTVLESWGVRFSEATLRKWVQWELLPRSVRVGHRGQQGGSQGQYPARIVRRILEIRRLLGDGYTVDQIRAGALLLANELEALERQIGVVFEGMERAVKTQSDEVGGEALRRELREARVTAAELVGRLRTMGSEAATRQRLARAAG